MRDTIEPGHAGTFVLVVTHEHTPPHLRPTVVLSTPLMIQIMENLCTDTVASHLDEKDTTVGTHVDVYHRSAAREGETVVFRCNLKSVEGRRLLFDVSAQSDERVVGEGIHERVVVDRSRFAG
jgi:fluoroacetyl-CoA thioesterase